jgi:hypothetical protein
MNRDIRGKTVRCTNNYNDMRMKLRIKVNGEELPQFLELHPPGVVCDGPLSYTGGLSSYGDANGRGDRGPLTGLVWPSTGEPVCIGEIYAGWP